MIALEIAFWSAAALVAYTYLVYPAALGLLAWLRPRPVRILCPPPKAVSVILAVHNEEARIAQRLDELVHLLEITGLDGEILVVSDGSTDLTASLAASHPSRLVRVLALPERGGKALALTAAWAVAQYEILVLADARQTWSPDALGLLLDNFTDPEVGAATGDLVVKSQPGIMSGVGAYWRFEKWLRRRESQVWAVVGATGAISAVRRELFRAIPPGTLLDDVYWPLNVVLQGYRVIHDERAHAYDRLPDQAQDEFRRKVRTLAGNFQLAARLPAALLPWRNPIWVQYVSHKLLRLAAPWALLTLLVASAALPGTRFLALFWGQILLYSAGLLGLTVGTRVPNRALAAISSFLVLNAAAFTAFWIWILGRAERSWNKTTYCPTLSAWPQRSTPSHKERAHVDSVS